MIKNLRDNRSRLSGANVMSLKREVKVYKNKIFLGPSQRGGIRVKMTPKIELGIEIFKKGSLRKGLYSK